MGIEHGLKRPVSIFQSPVQPKLQLGFIHAIRQGREKRRFFISICFFSEVSKQSGICVKPTYSNREKRKVSISIELFQPFL